MFLLVGLGNPGDKYARTRHNAGFDVIELLADKLNAPLNKKLCKAKVAETRVGNERVALAQPQTYMNLSGESVAALMNWYKVPPENLVVCYDDVDLDFGRLRVRKGGSAGTHNGMRSIIYLLGRDDFPRVRVGMGRAPAGWELADYVLAHFDTPEARKIAFDAYLDAVDVLLTLVREGVEPANRLAGDRWRARQAAAAERAEKAEKADGAGEKHGAEG